MSDLTVSQTILEQLGGGRFIAMTGAKQFIGSATTLSFRVPKAKDGITGVRITLTPMDLYDVEFLRLRGVVAEPDVVAKVQGAYAEDLRRVFTAHTGLDTTL